jgi:hypothetical protein
MLEPFTGQCGLSGERASVGGPTAIIGRTGGWPEDFTLSVIAKDTFGNTSTSTSDEYELSDDLEYPQFMNPFVSE